MAIWSNGVLFLLALSGLSLSCRVQPAPIVGKACDDAHPCPGQLSCVASVCCEPGACEGMDGGADADAGCALPPREDCGDARCVTTVAGRGLSERYFAALVYHPSRNALIFSEPNRQQVIELSLDDGGTRVLAGPGQCGQPADGLCFPTGLALESDEVLYIADPGNRVIRKLEGGQLSTFVASPQLDDARSLAVVGTSLFVGNNHDLLRINLASRAVDTLFAGWELGSITAVAASADGGLLFAAEHTVRSMAATSDGGHTLLSGQPGDQSPGYVEGSPSTARFGYLGGLTELPDGLYLADNTNHRLRVLAPATRISSTVVGTGARGVNQGSPLGTSLNNPGAVATNGTELFITTEPGYVYRFSPQAAAITPLIGARSWVTDGCARDVDLPGLTGLTRDVAGTLYFSDAYFHSVRALDARGEVRTLLGGVPGVADGPADAGRVHGPGDLAWRPRAGSPLGELVIADRGNGLIRAFDLSRGELRTLVGTVRPGNPEAYGCSAAFGPALSSARLCRPSALALGTARSIFIADSNYTATDGRISLYQPGLDSLSLFNQDFVPGALASAADGGLWVTSTASSLSRIERLDDQGSLISTLDFSTRCPPAPLGVGICRPSSIAASGATLFVTVGGAGLVGKLVGDSFSSIAGVPWQFGHRDGPGRSALFRWPDEMVDDGDGGLYVADEGNQSIRYIAP